MSLGSPALKFFETASQAPTTDHFPAGWGNSLKASVHPPVCYFFLGGTTASLKDFAKRNLTTVLAGILMGAPV